MCMIISLPSVMISTTLSLFFLFWFSCIFFFKQKTAYEMRISDWSSDVCSSDLDRTIMRALKFMLPAAVAACAFAAPAIAQEGVPEAALDSGDTAWLLTATALVLLMTIPGVALFYGGMVRKMNVLSTEIGRAHV